MMGCIYQPVQMRIDLMSQRITIINHTLKTSLTLDWVFLTSQHPHINSTHPSYYKSHDVLQQQSTGDLFVFCLDLCTKSKPKKLKSAFIHEETLTPPTGGPAGAAVQIVLAAL